MKEVITKEWLSAINELKRADCTSTNCPECGASKFTVREIRSDDDPDYLLANFYACDSCGASGQTRVAKKVPRRNA